VAGSTRRGLHVFTRITVIGAVVSGVLVGLASPASPATISSESPLSSITVTPDLNCDVRHAGDIYPAFYGGTACATLVVAGGVLYGPEVIPPYGTATGGTPFTPISQSGVTGAGTAGSPFRVVTVVGVGDSGLRVVQTDSYVTGQESYRTDVRVENTTGTPQPAIIYRAGDCYLENDDYGYGRVGPAPGAVACQSSTSARVLQWLPITPGSRYMESRYTAVWNRAFNLLPFDDSCLCTELWDNGAGLSWEATVPGNGSTTVSSIITFSLTGVLPLSTIAAPDVGTVAPGGANGYTVTVTNPNVQVVPLTTVTFTLPPGFTYTPGSTTGMTTANPVVTGRTLTWTGPFNVPASGSATLHFNVTSASSPGTYLSEADADGGGFSVAPTGPAAAVVVSGPPPCTTTLSGNRVGPWRVASGQHLCLTDGRFAGRVTVAPGGALTATNAQIAGGVVASGASWIRLCGSSVGTGLSVAGSPGPLKIGDPGAGCAGNRVAGTGVSLTDNTGTITLAGNAVSGAIRCSGNATAPVNNRQANTLVGQVTRTGQCAGM
jgi:hypothetical protein